MGNKELGTIPSFLNMVVILGSVATSNALEMILAAVFCSSGSMA